MKVAFIVGVRPEFVQCTPLLRELDKYCMTRLVHTGQHYDFEMNQLLFEQLNLKKPDYHLNVGSGSPGKQIGDMIYKIEEVLLKEKPNMILVFGDTNSTLAGALAASKLKIKVGHVEAGMRSFDKAMPEEINRILTDHCSDVLFCSTRNAVTNLRTEGIINDVYLTGDLMVDSLLYNTDIAEHHSGILDQLELRPQQYSVATVHRESNTIIRENLENIITSFVEADENIVFPIHPRTERFIEEYNLCDMLYECPSIKTIKPLGHLDFLKLIKNAKKIITDSGGIQKEAYILGVPCITLRNNTEWIETVEEGWNILVGTDKKKIIDSIREFNPGNLRNDVYAQGASKYIAKIIASLRCD